MPNAVTKTLTILKEQPVGCFFAALLSISLISAVFAGMIFIVAAIIAVPVIKDTISEQTGFHASVESLFLNVYTGECQMNYLSLQNPPAYNMSDIIKEEGSLDVFKTMRMPVVSALGVKLGIEDSTLSDIIDYLDGDTASLPDFESTAGYTDDAVVAAVREARTIVHSIGPNHTAVIPAYANGKDVAVDFLRFMATDIAQESYIRSTGGASLPFNYDLKEKNIELYNELHPLQQSRHDYFNAYEIYTLPSDRAFPLARYGGIKAFVTEHYYTTFSANGNQKTPGDYYDETISAWTSNKFNNALSNSGIVR